MGVAKATLEIDGVSLAMHAARLLSDVCDPVLEVGPGYTTLPTVRESQTGRGPLVALVGGADAALVHTPLLLLACDLPFVTRGLLQRIAGFPGDGTVVPVDRAGELQPVCARYSIDAIARARKLVAAGERSLRRLLDDGDLTVLETDDDRSLVDVDTPEDAARWGIRRPGSLEP
jgi:molybdopterin-guanine dinucleotide biosynthesis protein A